MESDDDWNIGCKNWVRGAKGLEYLQTGLRNVVAELVLRHRDQIVQNITSSIQGSHKQCNQCDSNNLLPEHAFQNECSYFCIQYKNWNCFGYRKINRRLCPNGICSKLYDEIVHSHRHTDPLWSNTDPSTWCSDPAGWSFAKCFQTKCNPGTSSSETDVANLLDIILNNTFFQNEVTCNLAAPNNYFSLAKRVGNLLLFTSKMELDDTELQDYLDTFIACLQDGMFTVDMSREAVQNIVELKNSTITTSLNEQFHQKAKSTSEFAKQTPTNTKEMKKMIEALYGISKHNIHKQPRQAEVAILKMEMLKNSMITTSLNEQFHQKTKSASKLAKQTQTEIKGATSAALDEIGKHEIRHRPRQAEGTIQKIKMACPLGIYKPDYLQGLLQRYEDIDGTPAAPPSPDWCNDSEEEIDDDGNEVMKKEQLKFCY